LVAGGPCPRGDVAGAAAKYRGRPHSILLASQQSDIYLPAAFSPMK
jgi:hypothetical protein